jgi:hypothetical protein
MTTKRILSFFVLISILLSTANVKAEFLYDPVVILINSPGGKGALAVTFVNPFKKPARLQISLNEWESTDNNSYVIKERKEGAESILNYIKVSPQQFTLAPNQKKIVRIATAIPSSYPDGEYKLFLSMLEIGADRKVMELNGESTTKSSIGLNINKQINAGTYVRKGAQGVFKCDLSIPKVTAEKVLFEATIDEKDPKKKEKKVMIKYHISYQNIGNVHTRKDIGVRFFDNGTLAYETAYTGLLVAYPTKPGQTVVSSGSFLLPEKLSPDKNYDAEFVFSPSPDELGPSNCTAQKVKSEKIRIN